MSLWYRHVVDILSLCCSFESHEQQHTLTRMACKQGSSTSCPGFSKVANDGLYLSSLRKALSHTNGPPRIPLAALFLDRAVSGKRQSLCSERHIRPLDLSGQGNLTSPPLRPTRGAHCRGFERDAYWLIEWLRRAGPL